MKNLKDLWSKKRMKQLKKVFKKADRTEAHKRVDAFYDWIEAQNKKKKINPNDLEAPRKLD